MSSCIEVTDISLRPETEGRMMRGVIVFVLSPLGEYTRLLLVTVTYNSVFSFTEDSFIAYSLETRCFLNFLSSFQNLVNITLLLSISIIGIMVSQKMQVCCQSKF